MTQEPVWFWKNPGHCVVSWSYPACWAPSHVERKRPCDPALAQPFLRFPRGKSQGVATHPTWLCVPWPLGTSARTAGSGHLGPRSGSDPTSLVGPWLDAHPLPSPFTGLFMPWCPHGAHLHIGCSCGAGLLCACHCAWCRGDNREQGPGLQLSQPLTVGQVPGFLAGRLQGCRVHAFSAHWLLGCWRWGGAIDLRITCGHQRCVPHGCS